MYLKSPLKTESTLKCFEPFHDTFFIENLYPEVVTINKVSHKISWAVESNFRSGKML